MIVLYRCRTRTNVLCPCGAVERRLRKLDLEHETKRVPYRRRGTYEQGWQIKKLPRGTELLNRARAARFVGGLPSGRDLSPGKKQSSIHKGRYRLLRPTVDEELKHLHQDVIDRLRIEASQ